MESILKIAADAAMIHSKIGNHVIVENAHQVKLFISFQSNTKNTQVRKDLIALYHLSLTLYNTEMFKNAFQCYFFVTLFDVHAVSD